MPKITIPVQGGKMSGYLTLPKKLPAPGVLVIQEIFGVNKVMRDLCDAYAKEGYVALCPDLFWRIEPGIDITDKTEKEWQRAFELFGLFDVAKGVDDLKAALSSLRQVKGCNGRAGSVGYCLGGKLAYLMATRSDADCNVSFYGVGIEGMLGEAGGIKKPLMLHIAGKDKFVSPAAQTQIRGALSLLPQVSIHVYDEQDHAFARIGGQHYDKAAATLANGRTRDFFARHLKKEVKVGDKVHAIRFEQAGGPEVMKWTEQTLAKPGKGEVLIRHTAIGLNYIDTYHRTGLYPMSMPSGLGLEAAGTIEAVGPGVKGLKVGDRVAYCSGPIGAYAQARVMPAEMLVPLPSGISDQQAAAVMLQGLTVQYLIRQIFKAKKGDTVLFHAAAGGVGLIACQWLKALGVTVIGTAGSKEKAALAKKAGCKHVILYREEDVAKRVKEITKGKGVPVVFDGVGKDTWMASLDSLSPRGLMVSFGNASGPVAPFAATLLAQKGSLFLTRPTLAHYANNRENLLKMAKDLFGAIKSGKIKIEIHQTYPLKDAAQAHRDLEARKTTGSTLLLP